MIVLPRANWPVARSAAPIIATLSSEQTRFIRLHQRSHDVPMRWRWMMRECQLRAYTQAGHTATISSEGFCDLVARGFMRRGPGLADVVLTEKGRRV